MYKLVASSVNHPDQLNELWGVFNHRSLTSLSRNSVDVTAIVPRPHAPPVGPFSSYRSIPESDSTFPYPVAHPRFWYYLPKQLFYHRSGDSMANSLEQWIRERNPTGDIYHGCHLFPDGYALGTLANNDQVPLTTYAHGTVLNSYEEFNRKVQARITEVLRTADCVFCSGNAIEELAQTVAPGTTTEVVPIGADPSNFPTDRQSSLRQELTVPDEATVVLFCGHFTEKKGIGDVLDILPDIEDESLYFVFIGHGGDLRAELRRELTGSQPPHGNVLWQRSPVAVRRWFAVADLFILPSYSEGRPTVLYEAMASQTPALATTVGGIPEQIEDGRTGWLFTPGDTTAFASKIQEASRDELRKMGKAAQKRLLDKGWTWDGHAKSIVEKHQSLLDQ